MNLRDKEEKVGEVKRAVHVCICTCVYVPIVFVGEVVYDGGADASHAPLTVVPSSCDDRELRSTQTLLTVYREKPQERNIHTTVKRRAAT